MLKLRDFLHLPQMDALIDRLINDGPGLIVLAGIESRPTQAAPSLITEAHAGAGLDSITPSGLSALFSILIQEILLARPAASAIVVAEERGLARVPRQLKRRVGFLQVDLDQPYPDQIEMAAKQRPGLLVIDRLDEVTAPQAFNAARKGLRVLTQFDTVLRGPGVAQQMLDLGITRAQIADLRWVITVQRMPVLCPHCKQPAGWSDELGTQMLRRYPHLKKIIEKVLAGPAKTNPREVISRNTGFFRAQGCERCHGTGYQGDLSVFDLYRNDPAAGQPFEQSSLLSLEEYALHLAAEGQLDLGDLLNLETDHLRRTYHMLTASQRALTRSNSELTRKLLELEASNRVLVQRTEVLMSLEDLVKALITSASLNELAARVCRRAGELCGADRVVLYLRRLIDGNQETAEILSVRGWESPPPGLQVSPAQVFGEKSQGQVTRYLKPPPGVRSPRQATSGETTGAQLAMGLRVPLVAQDQLVGAMIIQCTQKDHFSPGEAALLQTFANQAALAIQRAGLIDDLRAKIDQLEAAQAELVKKERMERELELARQVQQSMLPHSFPAIVGYEIAAQNEPARQVGGDFYDLIVLDQDHFGLVVADVADKGMPAALYMALAHSLILAEVQREQSPRSALLNVNRLLVDLGELNGFVSVFYGVIDCRSRKLTYARAGHERPLLLRGDQVITLGGEGAVLGILDSEELSLNEEEIYLLTGDRLVLFTDGLTDVANEQGSFYGLEGLMNLVRSQEGKTVHEICQAIYTGLANHRGQAEQFDDMTLLVIEVQSPS